MSNLLKSNLQKQIRRGHDTAITTFFKLLELSPFESLRRLVIISFEDVKIFQETAIVMWLCSVCSKGFVLRNKHKEWLAGYIKGLLNFPKTETTSSLNNNKLTVQNFLQSHYSQSEELLGIFFRTAYGGMISDINLIHNICNQYLQTNKKLESLQCQRIPIPNNKLFIHPAAIDFHVFPQLLSKFPNYNSEEIKKVIWECKSKKNWRKENTVTPELYNTWTKIKKDWKIEIHNLISDFMSKNYIFNN